MSESAKRSLCEYKATLSGYEDSLSYLVAVRNEGGFDKFLENLPLGAMPFEDLLEFSS